MVLRRTIAVTATSAAALAVASVWLDIRHPNDDAWVAVARLLRTFSSMLAALVVGLVAWLIQRRDHRAQLVTLVLQELRRSREVLETRAPRPFRFVFEGSELTAHLIHFHEVTLTHAVNSGLLSTEVCADLTDLIVKTDLYRKRTDRLVERALASTYVSGPAEMENVRGNLESELAQINELREQIVKLLYAAETKLQP